MRYRIAIDVGGTFTDLVYAGDGLASSRRPPPLRTRRRVYSSRQHRHQRLVANALATVNATFAGRPQQELENLPEKQGLARRRPSLRMRCDVQVRAGAGDGNRTRVTCLEGRSSTSSGSAARNRGQGAAHGPSTATRSSMASLGRLPSHAPLSQSTS